MLFQGLDKLKRSVLMTTFVLMFIGVLLMILPESMISFFGKALGFGLLVALVFDGLYFLSSPKALIHYILLALGLLAGLLGVALLAFEDLLVRTFSWLIGTVPLLLGIYGIYHALVFARRSKRKGWWVLILLSALLIAFGSVVFWNPWTGNPRASMQIMGGSLLFSALVSALSLIWIWPIHREGDQ